MNDYSKALEQETRNISQLANSGSLPLPMFRDDIVRAISDAISKGKSILISGPTGVGKTCIINGVATTLKKKQHIRELSTSLFMSNTKYLGEWESKTQSIISESKRKKAVLFITDIWNLPSTGVSNNNKSSVWDFLVNDVSANKLSLIGEVTSEKLAMMQGMSGFTNRFEVITVEPLSESHLHQIVGACAKKYSLDLLASDIKHIFQLCKNYQSQVAGPSNALELIKRIRDYKKETESVSEPFKLDEALIDKVFSLHSGLPLFVVSSSEVKPASEIRSWFRERVIGQELAIEAVTETIALYKAGIRDPHQPIGTFLFVGPTGVGKTELAKMLAKFLFGSENRLLRFDLSEYKDYHSYQMLVGNPENPNLPAKLIDPVKAQPFQVILLDEIEKAHPNIWDLLLQLLDEGRLTPANGKTTDFRSTIIIATSNVGSDTLNKDSIGFHQDAPEEISIKTLEQFFRPEILNRFQHIVSFKPLAREHLLKIARGNIQRILKRDGIADRNLAIDLDTELVEAIVDTGTDSRYGARALKRSVQKMVALPIANYLIENQVMPGSLLLLKLQGNRVSVRQVKTEETKIQKALLVEREIEQKKSLQKTELVARINEIGLMIENAKKALDKAGLELKLNELDAAKEDPGFWDDNTKALDIVIKAERINDNLERIYALDYGHEDLTELVDKELSTRDMEIIDRRINSLQKKIEITTRELLFLGDEMDVSTLIVLTPIGNKADARDFLYELYKDWARETGRSMTLLSQPQDDEDRTILVIDGVYAYGYLALENGLHRMRQDKDESFTCRVTVVPYRGDEVTPTFGTQQAMKQQGMYGEKINSFVTVVSEPRFRLRNAQTINENREHARKVAAALSTAQRNDEVVRRYDMQPFSVKDYLTDSMVTRKKDLKGRGFQSLLNARIDAENAK